MYLNINLFNKGQLNKKNLFFFNVFFLEKSINIYQSVEKIQKPLEIVINNAEFASFR